MFTGLIENIGTIDSIEQTHQRFRLHIHTPMAAHISIGDSVAVNGICLTANQRSGNKFIADIMPETAHRTEMTRWNKGKIVNLERALSINGRLDGHLVSGHVDGIGKIQSIRHVGTAFHITVRTPKALLSGIIPKGSVALDGISLTVIDCTTDAFTVGVIPHTYEHTALSVATIGDSVNIETDMVGKYVFSWLNQQSETISNTSLREILTANGYIK